MITLQSQILCDNDPFSVTPPLARALTVKCFEGILFMETVNLSGCPSLPRTVARTQTLLFGNASDPQLYVLPLLFGGPLLETLKTRKHIHMYIDAYMYLYICILYILHTFTHACIAFLLVITDFITIPPYNFAEYSWFVFHALNIDMDHISYRVFFFNSEQKKNVYM